jgi:hypothetical protein
MSLQARKRARRTRHAFFCVARTAGNEAQTEKRKTLTSLRPLGCPATGAEHHRILVFCWRDDECNRQRRQVHRAAENAAVSLREAAIFDLRPQRAKITRFNALQAPPPDFSIDRLVKLNAVRVASASHPPERRIVIYMM